MGILVGSAVVPITLCMCWGRLTGVAMVAGSVGGTLLALITWLSVASTYKGGLSKFLDNTGELTFCPGRDRANQTPVLCLEEQRCVWLSFITLVVS